MENYLENDNQALQSPTQSVLSSQKLSSQYQKIRSLSPIYQFDLDTEQQSNAITDTIAKLKAQETRQDEIMDALKNQLRSLRQQAELSQNLHSKEIHRIKDLYGQKISQQQNEGSYSIKQLKIAVEEAKQQLAKSQSFSLSLRQEIKNVETQTRENISLREREIKIMYDQDTIYKEKYLNISEGQIVHLQQTLLKLRRDNSQVMQNLTFESETQINDLKKQHEQRIQLLHSMQMQFEQLQEQKDKLEVEIQQTHNITKSFAEQLKLDLALQEQDLTRLRKAIANYHNSNKSFSREQQSLQERIYQLKSEQIQLKQEKSKYEKLVYGKK